MRLATIQKPIDDTAIHGGELARELVTITIDIAETETAVHLAANFSQDAKNMNEVFAEFQRLQFDLQMKQKSLQQATEYRDQLRRTYENLTRPTVTVITMK